MLRIRRSQAEPDSEDTAAGAEKKQKDAALDPDAMQQIGVGQGTLRLRQQGNADLRSKTQSDQRRDKQRDARRPEDTHPMDRLHRLKILISD